MSDESDRLLRARSVSSLCLLFALPEERRPLAGRAPRRDVDIDCSGPGIRKAAQKAASMLAAHRDQARGLLICGFAGGLETGLKPGEIVLADCVLDTTGEFDPATLSYTADSDLMQTAESVRLSDLSCLKGTLVTTARVLTTAREKRALGEQSGAIAVDMETAGAARVAQARGVPWLAVRAITDGADDNLPLDFNALSDADGALNRGRIVRATIVRPWKIPALIRLGARSSLAAINLARFLEAFLSALPE